MPVHLHSSYMESLRDLDRVVQKVAKIVEGKSFDTVVGTGMSGCLLLPLLAQRFNCYYLAVRKPGDGSHSCFPAEGSLGQRWIFVDDLIASGRTFARCHYTVQKVAEYYGPGEPPEFVGAVQYERDSWDEFLRPTQAARYLQTWQPVEGGRCAPVQVSRTDV